jgi:hypothetical protein
MQYDQLFMTCKGRCVAYKAQKPLGAGRYTSGQKRCQVCEVFLKWDGLWCPCCGYRLRIKPRNLKYKVKLRAKGAVQKVIKMKIRPLTVQKQYVWSIKPLKAISK